MRITYLCLLSLSLSLYSGTFAARPQIVDKIQDEIRPAKGVGVLNCTVALMGTKESNVQWWHIVKTSKHLSSGIEIIPKNIIGAGNVEKWQVIKTLGRDMSIPDTGTGTLTTFSLIIRFLERADSGIYKCQINLPGESNPDVWPIAKGRLTVQSQPQINPANVSMNQVVDEYSSVSMTCNAEGYPKPIISWTRANGRPLPIPGSPQRYIGSIMVLKNVTRAARGVYRCHAQNNVGTAAEYDISLDVNFKPETRPARVNGMYGQAPDGNFEATLECIVSGFPDPDVKWYKGVLTHDNNPPEIKDDELTEIEKMSTQGSAGMPVDSWFYTFKRWNIKAGDFGNYTCVASNKFGSDQTILNLFEVRMCQGPVCPKLNSKLLAANSINVNYSLLLFCTLFIIMIEKRMR